jgi:hypothetical protein
VQVAALQLAAQDRFVAGRMFTGASGALALSVSKRMRVMNNGREPLLY